MKNEWLSSMDSDGVYPDIFSFVFRNFGSHLFTQLHLFLDSSNYQSGSLYVPESLALQEAFNCVSRLAGALLFWFCSGSSSNLAPDIAGPQFRSAKASMQIKSISSVTHNLAGFGFSFRSKTKRKSPAPVSLCKISRFTIGLLSSEAKRLQSFPVLSLAQRWYQHFRNHLQT